ncbi:hypothetical protein D7X25_21600 [bacterium 1XD42-8]|jgi:hypothetical protein|nr:hypothetical protein [Lachnospiraceae bacterium]RKJ47795.1 hypothetical protein D7X25_21600 [bacterium 1XD42-8]
MMKEWRGSIKKCIMLVFILALGMFIIVACRDKTTKSDASDADGAVTDAPMDKIGGDICPCVMVNGVVYYDTGYKSSLDDRCEDMDGQITSECSGSEVPTQDNQSNFGKGYDYQYGSVEGTIEIQLTDGDWYVFATKEVKPNYKP